MDKHTGSNGDSPGQDGKTRKNGNGNGHGGGKPRRKKVFARDIPALWPDTTKDGHPKNTCANARCAIEQLGVTCRYNIFKAVIEIDGEVEIIGRRTMDLSGRNVDHAAS